ncbi:hypothetical protein PFISCL1PPCAC_12352, partial [Pristionchus fissidentatus]
LLIPLPLLLLAIQPIQENEIRERQNLNGLWTFVREPRNSVDIGLPNGWKDENLSKFKNATEMPVPSSFNEMGDKDLRDHLGWVWYEKHVDVPLRVLSNNRVFLRMDSVMYYAIVFVNGQEATRHEGGHLPFETEITTLLAPDGHNKFTIAVNNTLSLDTVPQAEFAYTKREFNMIDGKNTSRYPEGAFTYTVPFDFFHYSGILRPVNLLIRPKTFIDEYKIDTNDKGEFNYTFSVNGEDRKKVKGIVRVKDADGNVVFESKELAGSGKIDSAQLWFPRGMGAANLYTIEAELRDSSSRIDVFRETFGFRSVSWDANAVYVNGKRLYCMGVGWHEESPIRGRSFDRVMMAKDLSLFEWMGVNCFRTSHYPYAEETMREADRRGLAVIVEVPSVSPSKFVKKSQAVHATLIKEMITRDYNRPSVIMWSVSNEPFAFGSYKGGREYFSPLIDLMHKLDSTRPVTLVHGQARYWNDYLSDLLDVICINRYYGWYIDMGVPSEQIEEDLYYDISMWREKFKKPIMITEYGAEMIPGVLAEPSLAFSTQYQQEVFQANHRALDRLRKEGKITGEMPWVFADFATYMSTTRVSGNHK